MIDRAAHLLLVCGALAGGVGPLRAETAADKAKLCGSCHGAQGLPSDDTIPIVWGQNAAYLAKQLADYASGARDSQIMSSIAESLGGDTKAVADELAARPWPPARPAANAAQPSASAAALAETCQACHSGQSAPGATEIAPRLAGQLATYTVQTLDAMTGGDRSSSATMTAIARSLTPDQKAALAAYFARQ